MPVPPPFSLIPNLLVDGLIIAIVAFSVNMSMASIFARKLNYSIDANQELLASVSFRNCGYLGIFHHRHHYLTTVYYNVSNDHSKMFTYHAHIQY